MLLYFFQVDAMHALFKANADKPPIFKNQPPVAGAISWERSLFLRIKHTILRFQEMEDMLNSEQGKLVWLSSWTRKCVSSKLLGGVFAEQRM